MTDHDLVNRTMKEAQRSIADPVGPNPFNGEPAIEALREVQDYKRKQETIAVQAGPRLANLDRDRAIHLRWTLRDIKGKRMKLSPVSLDDLRSLVEMGLVEIRDDTPTLTDTGCRTIE